MIVIDEVGVYNDDMENVYNYYCIRGISDNVVDVLMLNLNYVIFVFNYFEEMVLIVVKNVMFFYVFWCVCKVGKDYIKCKWGEDYI